MSCAVLERKAGIISQQNEDLTESLNASRHLESILLAGRALGYQWRSLVSDIHQDYETFDYRSFRDKLLPLAEATRIILNLALQKLDETAPGRADLELDRHEVGNIVAWIETWPERSDRHRREAREQIAAGNVMTLDQFAEEMLQEAT